MPRRSADSGATSAKPASKQLAQGHHRHGARNQGGQARRSSSGSSSIPRCRRKPSPIPVDSRLLEIARAQGRQRGKARRHQSEADLCQGRQGAAPQGRRLCPCQAVQAPAQCRQAAAYDPGRRPARSETQAERLRLRSESAHDDRRSERPGSNAPSASARNSRKTRTSSMRCMPRKSSASAKARPASPMSSASRSAWRSPTSAA